MDDLQGHLENLLRDAIAAALGPEHKAADPLLRPSGNPKFGDFQANLAMPLGKQLGQKPREIAERVAAALGDGGGRLAQPAEVAGPGFINLMLSDTALDEAGLAMGTGPRLGLPAAAHPRHIVVDYCGTNVAKQMLVWHLRSTIIGDALVRVFEALGHRVTRQNHLGDWGTQFGMLIEFLNDQNAPEELEIGDLNAFYQQAKQKFDEDADFAGRARQRVVALQAGDGPTRRRWQQLVDASVEHFNEVCRRLEVRLTPADIRGESFYNDQLPAAVADLERAGLLRESQGARVVFPDGFENQEGEPLGMIVQKSDGGYLYATTDLAAALFRLRELDADRLVYVTDARQSQHFAMVFQTLRQMGAAGDATLEHVPFGTVLGRDRRPYKTRSGESIRLSDVLDEAVARAGAAIAEKNPDLPAAERARVAEAVGIGAVKYADLSNDRIKDYVFDYDRMLSLEGNTAPYLLYSVARIRSIFRRGDVDFDAFAADHVAAEQPAEKALVLKLIQLPGVIESVADTLEPHRLCNHLFELATLYHRFFEHCPVLKAEDATQREGRLALCKLTAAALGRGLGLLGIRVVQRM
jgi:arginyl-tRNA synthetase